jgi:glycosyltransferase involved in cell wall biosynthesis
MKEHMVRRGVPPGKIHVVPNAVDPGALRPTGRDRALARSLGVEDAEAVLGYVSTFHRYEGIPLIVEAVAELRERGRTVKALLVGEGNDRANIEATAARHGVSDAVVLTGRVEHDAIARYYGLMDIFVVPRRPEATSELVTPLKPFEAMSMGLTVVASRVRALCEVVADGRTGRTFTAGHALDLADVCEELMDDPAQRLRLAAHGREWVTAERTWAHNAQRYRRLYAEMGAA